MPRIPIVKKLINTKLASSYGGWIYCDNCGENIGYLCYVTYDSFCLSYQCKCGGCGSIRLAFKDNLSANEGDDGLITIKNRLCCPHDDSPLFTLLYKKLERYRYEVLCTKCGTKYTEGEAL